MDAFSASAWHGIPDERPALKAHGDEMIELWPMPHAKSRRFRKTARRTESSDLSYREAGTKTENGTPSLLLPTTTQTVCNGSAERLLCSATPSGEIVLWDTDPSCQDGLMCSASLLFLLLWAMIFLGFVLAVPASYQVSCVIIFCLCRSRREGASKTSATTKLPAGVVSLAWVRRE